MRFYRNQPSKTLPKDFRQALQVCIDNRRTCGNVYLLCSVNPEDFVKLPIDTPEAILGFPAYFCVAAGRINLYPIPDKIYNIEITYQPQVKKI